MAVDPKVLDERGNNGKGKPTSDLLPPEFKWYPGVSGPKFDPEAAKKLVAAAKADGWDGKIRLTFNSSPVATNTGLAVQAELTAVGMNPQLDTSKDVTGQVVQIVTTEGLRRQHVGDRPLQRRRSRPGAGAEHGQHQCEQPGRFQGSGS